MTVIIFLLITYFGYLFSHLLIKEMSLLERLGLSYLLGIGLFTLLIFFGSWMGIKISTMSVLISLLLLLIILQFLCDVLKRNTKIRLPKILLLVGELNLYEKLTFSLIVIVIGLSFLMTSYYPVNVWDALALYDFRAKIIAQMGYFTQIANQFTYFAHYPLLTSLTHTIVYLFGANNPQFTYSLYLISFAAIFFSIIKKNSGRLVALLATLILVSSPIIFKHSTLAYTNLPYTVFYVTGVAYLYFSVINDRLDYMFVSSLLIGLSTWARAAEPFWVTGIVLVLVYSTYKKSLYPLFVYLPTFLIIQQPWNIYLTHYFGKIASTSDQIMSASGILFGQIDVQRVVDVSTYIYKNILLSWGPIAILFLVTIFIDLKNKSIRKHLTLLLVIFTNILLLFIGTYVFSINTKEWKDIPDSARRMSMFFVPLMIYYVGLVSGKVIFSIKKLKRYERKEK